MKRLLNNVILLFLLLTTVTAANSSGQPGGNSPSGKNPVTVYTIGDSTMADKIAGAAPETGWCQALRSFVDSTVCLKNRAANGRSTKSFLAEKRWKAITDSLKRGDFVIIQFGHNDEKIQDTTRYTEPHTSYRQNLARFVRETRDKGATPILCTSIVRRKFENGYLVDSHGDYPLVTRQLAAEMNVPLVDLQLLTAGAVTAMGEEDSKKMFLWTPPSEKYPQGRKDDTHLCREGANLVARLAAQQLRQYGSTPGLSGRIILRPWFSQDCRTNFQGPPTW